MKRSIVVLLCLIPVALFAQQNSKKKSAEETKEGTPVQQAESTVVQTTSTEPKTADNSDHVIKELLKSVNELKKQNEKQNELIKQLQKEQEQSVKEVKSLQVSARKNQAAKKAAENKKKNKKKPAITFHPYGRIDLRGWANDAQFLVNDKPVCVADQDASSANITIRDTRLGFVLAVPGVTAVNMSARLEIDFFGNMGNSFAAEVIGMPRLRHAYFDIHHRFKSGTTIGGKFGQTWATAIVPLFPVLSSGGWGAGNLWQRLPLGDLYLEQEIGKSWKMHFSVAAAKPMSGASPNRNSYVEFNIDAGAGSHWPALQTQLWFGGSAGSFTLYFAAAASYSRENYEHGVLVNNLKGTTKLYGNEVENWSFDSGMKIFHKYGYLQGKFFIGNNLDLYGAFSSGVTYSTDAQGNKKVLSSQRAMGYWGELHLTPFKQLDLFTGVGGEKPDTDQTGSCPVFEENTAFWVGASYTFFDRLTLMFYWHQIQTEGFDTGKKDGVGDPIRKDLTGNSYSGLIRFAF